MRVIFETRPTPMTLIHHVTGLQYKGFGRLEVIAFDPNEQPPKVPGTDITYRIPRPLSILRAEGQGRVVAIPVPSFRASMAPVVIPESALASLPEGAKLYFGWHFTPGAP